LPRLQGKIALITGTGGGQGRAAALLFAKEGAQVFGCDLNAENAEETVHMVRRAGGEMVSKAPVDLSVEAQAEQWVSDAVATYGGIDIVYNNAGAARPGPLASMSTASWRFTLGNELDLVYFVSRAAWPHLVARGGGSIINTASIIGWRTSDLPMAARGASKSGVVGLTVHMAVEGGPDGIRANCISPGLTQSPALDPMLKDPFDSIQKQVRTSPLGRIGRPEDIAPLALFLASDESSYITGVNIVVDGGQSLGIGMMFRRDDRASSDSENASPGGEPISIRTDDGIADAYIFRPEKEGTWPAVLLYTDIMGVRPVFKTMAQRLADAGFIVLLPNLFYRSGPPDAPPLSVHVSGEFAKLMTRTPTLTADRVRRDAAAYIDALIGAAHVRPGPIGCVGYCMSGAMAIRTAANFPDRVGAAASFHGGDLSTNAPESPDRMAASAKAQLYFGFAETDAFMSPDKIATLQERLTQGGVRFESEIYPGTYHGFAIEDAGYDEAGCERHWQALTRFLKQALHR
jgi:NAD(P)-dependent dehydrogenase (short-subunit alcohol dehydrogenase family)/dienelactone hydrolase